jgi:hypothetical protein
MGVVFEGLKALIPVLTPIIGHDGKGLPGLRSRWSGGGAGAEIHTDEKESQRTCQESDGRRTMKKDRGKKEGGAWYQKCLSRQVEQEGEGEVFFSDPPQREHDQQEQKSICEGGSAKKPPSPTAERHPQLLPGIVVRQSFSQPL